MKRSYTLLLGVAAACVAVDQWTKHWATTTLAFAEPMHVIGSLVQFTYTRNSGIAFGLFAGRNYPFFAFSILAAVAVLVLFTRHPRLSLARQLSLALIMGGAIGNFIDRVRSGEVVDFIYLSWRQWQFWVFNVADVCVTVGVVLFALSWTSDSHEPAAAAPAAATATEGDPHAHSGSDGPAGERGAAGGPLAGEGADRPLP